MFYYNKNIIWYIKKILYKIFNQFAWSILIYCINEIRKKKYLHFFVSDSIQNVSCVVLEKSLGVIK